MDIYAIDQACADIDKTIGYIRKIVIEISSIAEKKWKQIKKKKKRKEEIEKLLLLIQMKNTNKYQDMG